MRLTNQRLVEMEMEDFYKQENYASCAKLLEFSSISEMHKFDGVSQNAIDEEAKVAFIHGAGSFLIVGCSVV